MSSITPREFQNQYTSAFTHWLELLNEQFSSRGISSKHAEAITVFLQTSFSIRQFSQDDFTQEIQDMTNDFFESKDALSLVGDKNLLTEAAAAVREVFKVWNPELMENLPLAESVGELLKDPMYFEDPRKSKL